MKWDIRLQIKNVDDDLDRDDVTAMIAAQIDVAHRSLETAPFKIESIEARKPRPQTEEGFHV